MDESGEKKQGNDAMSLPSEPEKVKQNSQEDSFYYGRISEQVIASGIWAKLSKKAAKVYIALLSHARDMNKNWEVWPSNETLARESGYNERDIPAARREIERAGLVARKWRVDKQIHYRFAGSNLPAVEKNQRKKATTPRPRNHRGRFTTAENATVGNSTTYGEPVPQIMEAVVPQIMDTKHTPEANYLRKLSPVESEKSAHAQGNEGRETALPSVNDTAIPNNQEEGKRVGKGRNIIPLQRNEVDTYVHSFYSLIGQPKVTKSLLKHGRKQLTELLDAGWTLKNIATAIDSIKHGPKDDKGRPADGRGRLIGSIGYLAHMIGSAVEEAEAKEAAEVRRQAQAALRAQDEARCVREAEDYVRQQQENRRPVQSEARPIRTANDSYEKAEEAYQAEWGQWRTRFLTYMREKGGGEARNASEADEMEFRRLYLPPKRPERREFVPISGGMNEVMANMKLNWPAAVVSA